MADWKAVVDIITLVLVGIGGYALFLVTSGGEAAVRTTAEETAKATIARLEWPAKLTEELQKIRGIERQELRYQSYPTLWGTLLLCPPGPPPTLPRGCPTTGKRIEPRPPR